jgi:hypothetical protein
LLTGFEPRFGVVDGINDVINSYRSGKIADVEDCYNVKAMKMIPSIA